MLLQILIGVSIISGLLMLATAGTWYVHIRKEKKIKKKYRNLIEKLDYGKEMDVSNIKKEECKRC